MSHSQLERGRQLLEAAEGLDSLLGQSLSGAASGQKAKVLQQHYIAALSSQIASSHQQLLAVLADSDNSFAEEIASMKGPDRLANFYQTLNTTREYYAKFPNAQGAAPLAGAPDPASIDVPFSGEEVFGKYMDLHEQFQIYLNVPGLQASSNGMDYLQYLDRFNNFFHIPENTKQQKQYRAYIHGLWEYLAGYFKRVQPLVKLDELVKDWGKTFESKWATGQVRGWPAKAPSGGAASQQGQIQRLDLSVFNDPSELDALGADRVKSALEAMGLKCGGTPKERVERLWSVRGLAPDQIPKKLLAKPSGGGGGGEEKKEKEEKKEGEYDDKRKQTAWEEFRIISLCEALQDVVTATRRHAEKQQTRTREEKEAELREEEFGVLPEVEEADSDDEEPIYNPLNIPLGWDDKPIPYWLYKLHGLGVEYKCEICGNQSYWGRRAFDRHFQELKHANGMRALGIPNTKHFHDITTIADAQALYAKLQGGIESERFHEAVEAEYEDSHGNVLDRRTYEDLYRQGLL